MDEQINIRDIDTFHKHIQEHVPGAIVVFDVKDGMLHMRYVSDNCVKIGGFTPGELSARAAADPLADVHPEDRKAFEDSGWDTTQQKLSFTYRVMCKDGQYKWVRLDLSRVEENGEVLYYGFTSDVDESYKLNALKKELERDKEKERILLNSIPGGIAVYHLKKNGKVATEYVSEPLAQMCGYTAEEFLRLLQEDALVNLVPEDIPRLNAAVEKSLEKRQGISVAYRIYKKDKSIIWIRLDANMIEFNPTAEDVVGVFYAVHTLVSEEARRMMEEQKSLSLLLNSVPAGIGIFRVENGVLSQEYMNNAFFEILHTTREQCNHYSGKNALASIHPDDMPRAQTMIQELLQGAPSAQVDYRVSDDAGGYIWLHVKMSVTERKEGYIRFFAAFFDCTESKEQELMLLQNERAVKLAQDQGDLAIWTYNIDKGIIYQQVQCADVGHMGYQVRVEQVPECFVESGSVYPEDTEKFLEAYKALARGEEKADVTYRLLDRQTGAFVWLRMFYRRMENSSNNDRMAVGFSMNVDKQQEAIERYRTEKSLREQMNENVLMYIEYNLTKECYEDEGKTVKTYRKAEWEGVTASGYLAALQRSVEPDYVEAVAQKLYAKNLLKAFASGETKVFVEYRSKARPEQPSVWYRTTASLVKRPDTGDVMAFIYVENIEKEKERKLAMESSLRDGIESIAVIRIADGHARLLRDAYSPAEKVLEGEYFVYDDDFVWRSHNAVVEEDSNFSYEAGRLSTIIKELARQEIYQYSIGTHSKIGVFKRQLFRYRYLDDRKKAVIMSVSDITSVYLEEQAKKKQIEHALAETKKASSAKAEFYARMSHDMRTPMNGILGLTALSKDETDAAVLKENLRKIEESGKYLLGIINDTLDMQRIESGKLTLNPEIVDCRSTIENAVDMVRPAIAAKHLQFQIKNKGTILDGTVHIDPVRIKQIFVNLISNAIKFTPEGGKISFEFECLGKEGNIAHDRFTIRDSGVGMSEQFIKERIFKSYAQEQNAYSNQYAGTGLGLSIAKKLVELMGGTIEVESKLGQGSAFTICLDIEHVDEATARAAVSVGGTEERMDATEHLKGCKILLAEDHPLNAEIATKLLEKVGCTVTWVKDGQACVDTMEQFTPGQFDVILMDLRMPVMDGLTAARQIRALKNQAAKAIPIIAMTANAYSDDVKHCLAAGMNAHIAKPIDPQTLYNTLAVYVPQGLSGE